MPDRLSSFPWIVVRIACRSCRRHGSYRLARLAEAHGAEIALDDLLTRLAADCPLRPDPTDRLRKRRKLEATCGARFTDLDGPSPPPPDLPPALSRPRLVVVNRDLDESA